MSLLNLSLVFAACLVALLLLSQWNNRRIQLLGLRVTGSSRAAILGYYLLMFPGILLHELSHYLMARLLGLKAGKFSLGPRPHGKTIELGSVSIARGGVWRDSLVGLAPFLAGTVVLLLISHRVFDMQVLDAAWTERGIGGITNEFARLLKVKDFWVWIYLIFAVSNAMMPSASDREPWRTAGLYLGLALVVVWLLGWLPAVSGALRTRGADALRLLSVSFVFANGVNAIVALALTILTLALAPLARARR